MTGHRPFKYLHKRIGMTFNEKAGRYMIELEDRLEEAERSATDGYDAWCRASDEIKRLRATLKAVSELPDKLNKKSVEIRDSCCRRTTKNIANELKALLKGTNS